MPKSPNKKPKQPTIPSTERVQEELAQAKSMDDFFGKEGVFARLFADALEQMQELQQWLALGEHAVVGVAALERPDVGDAVPDTESQNGCGHRLVTQIDMVVGSA